MAIDDCAPLLPRRAEQGAAHQELWVVPSTRPHRHGTRWRPPVSARMCRPGSDRLYRSLVVVDVDLDTRSVLPLVPTTPPLSAPEGVHALVWFHGLPVGELTVPGAPDAVLAVLADLAAHELQPAVTEHLLQDALAVPWSGRPLTDDVLRGVQHPVGPPVDASQVTVAVCSRDRPGELARCLEAIEGLDTPVGDVIVVDNAPSSEQARAVVARHRSVRYVREPRQGLAWARNRALLEARTPLVAFTDDDVQVHPGWADALARTFAEEPDAVCVTGLVTPAELSTPAQVAFEATSGFGRGYARRWVAVDVAGGEVAARVAPGVGVLGTGASMAFRREALVALGGFDTALGAGTPTGGAEDLEVLFRLAAAGHALVYEPSAVARHRHRRSVAELVVQRRGDGTGLFSMLIGAGAEYGGAQRRWLALHAVRWFLVDNVRAVVGSLFWPQVRPPFQALAKALGSVSAITAHLYERSRQQAMEQAERHPDEPVLPVAPVRSPPSPRNVGARAVLSVDLRTDDLADGRVHPTERPQGGWVSVRVHRGGRTVGTLTLRSGAARLSAGRLRVEVVQGLRATLRGTERQGG